MPSEQRGMPPKKGKDLRKPLEHLKMWNELVCQFRPVCDNHPTALLTHSPRKGSRQRVVTRRWGQRPHLQGFHGCFKSILPE
ncbi:hypothetical protein TNCV_2166461 [Trichonephila clavipes]|nr:hypothetical protein TNCV_2166461 [Trichonephila clavipes]